MLPLSQGRLFFYSIFFFDAAGADFYSFITELSVQHRRGQLLKGVGGACLFCRWQPATPTDKFKSAHFCTAAALLFAPWKTTILCLWRYTCFCIDLKHWRVKPWETKYILSISMQWIDHRFLWFFFFGGDNLEKLNVHPNNPACSDVLWVSDWVRRGDADHQEPLHHHQRIMRNDSPQPYSIFNRPFQPCGTAHWGDQSGSIFDCEVNYGNRGSCIILH